MSDTRHPAATRALDAYSARALLCRGCREGWSRGVASGGTGHVHFVPAGAMQVAESRAHCTAPQWLTVLVIRLDRAAYERGRADERVGVAPPGGAEPDTRPINQRHAEERAQRRLSENWRGR